MFPFVNNKNIGNLGFLISEKGHQSPDLFEILKVKENSWTSYY